MIICDSCQTRNSDQSTFCLRCGSQLNGLVQPDPGDSTDAMPAVAEATAGSLVARAATQLAEGRVEEALSDCRRAIALEPSHIEAHALLGMAYEQQGDLDAALEAYEAVLALDSQRTVERQKANLLRLRIEGRVPADVPLARKPTGLAALWSRVMANPPVAWSVAAALVVFLVGSIVLAHAQSKARTQEELAQILTAGDQAYDQGRYADATRLYAQAYELAPGDEELRTRWDRAYQLSLQQAGQQVAQLPQKYLGAAPNAINPFSPVPIGGQQAVPPPTATDTGAVPPPAAPPRAYDYDSWSGGSKNLTPSPVAPATTSENDTKRPEGNSPITPVQPKPVKEPATTAPTATSTPQGPKYEINIEVYDRPAGKKPVESGGGTRAGAGADALRSQAEQLAGSGRRDEAIESYQKAANAYDDAARSDPSGAAAHSQSAASCRARIEVLKMGQ